MAQYKKYFPQCLSKPACQCFNELLTFDAYFKSSKEYIQKAKTNLEKYINIAKLHENKDVVVDSPIQTVVSGNIVKSMIYYLNLSRIHFLRETKERHNFKIDVGIKSVSLSEFLRYFEEIHNCWDMMMNFFCFLDSELNMMYLKEIFKQHQELILVFEQFEQRIQTNQTLRIVSYLTMQSPFIYV